MNQHASAHLLRSFRRWWNCLFEILFFLPILLLIKVYLVPEFFTTISFYSLPLVILAGVLMGGYVSAIWSKLGLSLLIGAVYAGAMFIIGSHLMISALIGFAFAVQGITSVNRKNHSLLYWVGVSLYLMAGIIYPMIPSLDRLLPLLTGAGILCLGWTLLISNQSFLRYNNYSQEASDPLPNGIQRHNRIWIGGIVLAAAILATTTGRLLGVEIRNLIRAIISWISKKPVEPIILEDEAVMDVPVVPPLDTPLLPELAEGTGELAPLLNKGLHIFSTVLLVVFLAIGLYLVIKNWRTIWRRTVDMLQGLLNKVNEPDKDVPYDDEEIKLLNWRFVSQKWKIWRNPWFSASSWKRTEIWDELIDNQARVRYLYRQLLRSEQAEGYESKAHLTPMETEDELSREPVDKPNDKWLKRRSIASLLINLYYRARYGDQPIGNEELIVIKKNLDV